MVLVGQGVLVLEKNSARPIPGNQLRAGGNCPTVCWWVPTAGSIQAEAGWPSPEIRKRKWSLLPCPHVLPLPGVQGVDAGSRRCVAGVVIEICWDRDSVSPSKFLSLFTFLVNSSFISSWSLSEFTGDLLALTTIWAKLPDVWSGTLFRLVLNRPLSSFKECSPLTLFR